MTAVVKNMDRAMADMNLEKVRLSSRLHSTFRVAERAKWALTKHYDTDLAGDGQIRITIRGS